MNLIILSQNPSVHFVTNIVNELRNKGLYTKVIDPHKITSPLSYFLEKNPPLDPAQNPICILHRVLGMDYNDHDLDILQQWQSYGALTLNSPEIHLTYRDKLKQYKHLTRNGIPMPLTIKPEHVDQLKENVFPQNTKKFIVKTQRGCQGKGVYLSQNFNELKKLLLSFYGQNDYDYLVQPYIEDIVEYRLILLDGKVLGAIKKSPSHNKWMHNASSANWSLDESPDQALLNLAQKVYQVDRPFFCAIDLITNPIGLQLLELNLCPGIEQYQRVSGENIFPLIAQQILSKQ